ncbi:hypothetical protein FS837_006071 [Tulasnella sp. UAMH 9824]|nr:hypothetical protein FS837_006071 [Tulasnella sp. UAMH 9824]
MDCAPNRPEQQVFDTLDDDEASNSHTRPDSGYELLTLFPSFNPPDSSFSAGVAGSNPTGDASPDLSPGSAEGPLHSEHSQSKGSPRMRPFETSQEGAEPPAALAEPIAELWLNPEAEVWKPKRLSAERNLPTTAYVAPVHSAYPSGGRSTSSAMTDLSIKPPPSMASGISASSHVETSTSILNSQFGTSSSGSFSRFPSSAGLTSSYTLSSRARSAARGRVPYEDGSPIEPSGPRQTLFVVNDNPSSLGPERLRVLSGPSPQPDYDSDSTSSSSAFEGSIPAEWIYPVPLTLEELFKGGTYTYRITTRLLSGEPKIQEVQIDVKPGWKTGTRIVFPDAGNERAPGVFQTMIFMVEQIDHQRFTRREGGKLVYTTDIDLVDALEENGRREARKVVGLDGKVIEFYPPKGVIKPGQEMVIKGEGMYTRSKSKVVGRGDLIVRWNIKFPDQVTPDLIHRIRDVSKL